MNYDIVISFKTAFLASTYRKEKTHNIYLVYVELTHFEILDDVLSSFVQEATIVESVFMY